MEEILNLPQEDVEVVDIQFRPGQKIYFFDPDGVTYNAGDHVIMDTARGAEYGICTAGIHHIPAKDLEKAAEAALKEDWPLASALYQRAEKHWQKHRNLTATLAHHSLIEQIDIEFSMLADYSRCRDTAPFAATCSQIALQLRSLPQSHAFSWQNLL